MFQVSVIIRTLNEGKHLGSLLESIHCQVTNLSYEVVLIDSGSTDNTLHIAEAFRCRILHIKREDFSFGRSLNIACDAAYGQYLIMISGHCIPTDCFWMQKLVEPLIEKIVDYSYGRQIGGEDTYWSESQIFNKYFPSKSRIPQEGFYCNNANSAISRSAWKKYRFDEDLTGLEDMHLAKKIVADGGTVGYVANAKVFHLHHESWRQIQRRFEREALALQEICPELLLKKRDSLRYFFRALVKDFSANLVWALRPSVFISIVLYRFHQFKGSYKGSSIRFKVSRQLKESYFYPTGSKGPPLTKSNL